MPFDGTGIYNPPAAPAFPAVGGTVIQAEYYNTVIRDLGAGLTNTLKRDGQGAWIGPQNAGGQKLMGLGKGNSIVPGTEFRYGSDVGTAENRSGDAVEYYPSPASD